MSAQGGLYDVPNRKNVDRATHGATDSGFYCLHTTVSPNNIVATLYGSPVEGGEIRATYVTDIHCDATTNTYNVQVNTFDSGGLPKDRAFYVAIN